MLSKIDARWRNWILFFAIAAVAIALRLYAIDRLPPGLFADEAVEGLDALDIMAGNLNIWFHSQLGREPIYVYLVALSYQFFGVTPLATRLPAIIAGLITIPITFGLTREWASQIFSRERARFIALITTILITISFWHIQMTRDAHRDTLLPLVEAIGYWLLWRGIRLNDWKTFAVSGAILGLAIYTYSPGRFVGILVAAFVLIELIIYFVIIVRRQSTAQTFSSAVVGRRSLVLYFVAGLAALIVMLPLGIYFAQNPDQFSRRFGSVSIFDQTSPTQALVESVTGNLAQFVVSDAGYQSKHYNLPGKPIFDLLIAPWFLAGVVIACARWKKSQYRFLLLWFVILCVPAFLTADMIPKGVRVLGVVPGVFIFPALAFEAIDSKFRNSQFAIRILFAVCLIGSAIWTTYDYFIAWANLPELPLSFNADLVEVSDFINRQPTDQSIYLSQEVYRPPTQMLLGEHISTNRYIDRATRFKEMDARTALIAGANQPSPIYVFNRDYVPPDEWLARVAPQAIQVERGEYFVAYRLGAFAPPQRALDQSFNSYMYLIGASLFNGDDGGILLYWQVAGLPNDRQDMDATLSYIGANRKAVATNQHRFGVSPLEWNIGDTITDWYAQPIPDDATQFSIQFKRGATTWQSAPISLR